MGLEFAATLCRFVHDAALILLWGAAGFIAWMVPRELAAEQVRLLRPWARLGVALVLLAVVASLPLQAARIGSGWSDMGNPSILRPLLFKTTVGLAWQVEALCALLLLAPLFVPRPARPSVLAIAAGLGLASLSLTGHAAAQYGWLGRAHRINDVLHLLSGGAWVGALVPLALCLAAIVRPDKGREAVLALYRFSTAAAVAVAIVIATGVVNTWLILGTWPRPWVSSYQALLVAKIGLVLAMLGLAAVNRFVFTPRLPDDTKAATRIRHHAILELYLGLAVIALVAVFGQMDPTASW